MVVGRDGGDELGGGDARAGVCGPRQGPRQRPRRKDGPLLHGLCGRGRVDHGHRGRSGQRPQGKSPPLPLQTVKPQTHTNLLTSYSPFLL